MIKGVHAVIYSSDAEADMAFLQDVLKLPNVDMGDFWLVFGLPPSEVAIRPSDENQGNELYFMVKDIRAFVEAMKEQKVPCSDMVDAGWGLLVEITMPSGTPLSVYQPRHLRPDNPDPNPYLGWDNEE